MHDELTVFSAGKPADEDYLQNGFYSNSSVLEINNKVIIIDTPMLASHAQNIIKDLEGKKIEAIINTHGHLDHHLSNCLFETENIIQSKTTDAYLRSFKDYIGYYAGLTEYEPVIEEMKKLHVKYATIVYDESYDFLFEDTKIHLEHYGQSESEDASIAYVHDLKYLFTGDIVYHKVHPFIGNINVIDPWIGVLKKLLNYDCNLYIPGHGEPFEESSGIDEMIQYLEVFKNQFTFLMKKGYNNIEIKKNMELGRFNDYAMKKSFFEFSVDCCIKGYPQSANSSQ
jgi:glyoxylase-like metal-dependent hydrolase (beta-lactamase superfamily II)